MEAEHERDGGAVLLIRRFHVQGTVQGVGFRWFVRQSARPLNLAGIVRNERDGSVSVVAQGSDDSLRALQRALCRGPAGSRVQRVDCSEVSADSCEVLPLPFVIER